MVLIYVSGVLFAYYTLRKWQKEEYGDAVETDWFDVVGALTSSLGSWVSFFLIIFMKMNDDHLSNGKPPKWL